MCVCVCVCVCVSIDQPSGLGTAAGGSGRLTTVSTLVSCAHAGGLSVYCKGHG